MNISCRLLEYCLRHFYRFKANFFLSKYKRLVPFGDMVSERWQKASILGFGAGSSIYDSSLVLGDVKIGKNTWVGPQTVLDGFAAPLTIGDYCSISTGVQIYTHNTVKWSLTGGIQKNEPAPVNIGSFVYIGPQTVITKGVNIGNRVIVGACSYVDKSFDDYSVIWGQPAKLIGKVIMNDNGSDYVVNYE